MSDDPHEPPAAGPDPGEEAAAAAPEPTPTVTPQDATAEQPVGTAAPAEEDWLAPEPEPAAVVPEPEDVPPAEPVTEVHSVAEPVPVLDAPPAPTDAESQSPGAKAAVTDAAATAQAKVADTASGAKDAVTDAAATAQAKVTDTAAAAQAKVGGATGAVQSTTDERPEILVGAAFAGGAALALLLKAVGGRS